MRGALAELGQDMLELCRHPIYLIGSVGCTFHTAVLGLYGAHPGCSACFLLPSLVQLAAGARNFCVAAARSALVRSSALSC